MLQIKALVGRAKEGDHDAFEALYRRTSGRIYALCLRMCGNADEAEELTQDVYVRCWQKLETFRGDSQFTTWLHRLAVNLILQQRRKWAKTSERERGTADLERFGHRAVEALPETKVDLERAIASLPKGAREVLVLRDCPCPFNA